MAHAPMFICLAEFLPGPPANVVSAVFLGVSYSQGRGHMAKNELYIERRNREIMR